MTRFDPNAPLVLYDSEDITNVGLYKNFGFEYGVDVGIQASIGLGLGNNPGGSSLFATASGGYGAEFTAVTAGDLSLAGIWNSPVEGAAFVAGPGGGVGVGVDYSKPVFTLNNLQWFVGNAIYEGRLSDE